jgi:hypothetical protein
VVVDSDGLRWRKSSLSGTSNCVEVAFTDEAVFVRHSQHPEGPRLTFSHDAWKAFLTELRRKPDFDSP